MYDKEAPTAATNKTGHVTVIMPGGLEAVTAFDSFLKNNNWKQKRFGMYYNSDTMEYLHANELYPMFRNSITCKNPIHEGK